MKVKKNRVVILVVLLLLGGGFAFYFGRDLLFLDQWPVFDGLRQTAAIIFGLSGAYIAIVYPAALAALLRRQELETKEVSAFKNLLTSMELSFGVLVAVLLAGFCAPIIRHNDWCVHHIKFVCGMSFALSAVLTITELLAVVFILLPLDSFTRDVEHGRSARRIINGTLPSQSDVGEDE